MRICIGRGDKTEAVWSPHGADEFLFQTRWPPISSLNGNRLSPEANPSSPSKEVMLWAIRHCREFSPGIYRFIHSSLACEPMLMLSIAAFRETARLPDYA